MQLSLLYGVHNPDAQSVVWRGWAATEPLEELAKRVEERGIDVVYGISDEGVLKDSNELKKFRAALEELQKVSGGKPLDTVLEFMGMTVCRFYRGGQHPQTNPSEIRPTPLD
jgi:hypothetical protein